MCWKPFLSFFLASFMTAVDEEAGVFAPDQPGHSFSHPYPPTKLMFVPDPEGSKPDLLASAGDHLRLWRIEEDRVTLDCLLSNVSGCV